MQGEYENTQNLVREQRGEPTPYAVPSLGVMATDLEGLTAALNRESRQDRFNAIKALSNLRDQRAVEPLLAIFQNPDEALMLRERASMALGRIRDERALAPLIDALRTPPSQMNDIKVMALLGNPESLSCDPTGINALGNLTVRESLEQMRQVLGGMIDSTLLDQMPASLTPDHIGADISDHLGHAIGQALMAFGPGALPALTAALDDPDLRVRCRISEIIPIRRKEMPCRSDEARWIGVHGSFVGASDRTPVRPSSFIDRGGSACRIGIIGYIQANTR